MSQILAKYYIIFEKKFPFWKLLSKLISILETFNIVRVFQHPKIYRKTINLAPKHPFVQKRAFRFGTVAQP